MGLEAFFRPAVVSLASLVMCGWGHLRRGFQRPFYRGIVRALTAHWPLARNGIVRNAMVVPCPCTAHSQMFDHSTSSVRTQSTLLSATAANSLVESRSNFNYARRIVTGLVSQYLSEHASNARLPRKGLPMEIEDEMSRMSGS